MGIAHGLWGQRNTCSREEGRFGLPRNASQDLEEKIREQFQKGREGLEEEMEFLLDKDVEEILDSKAQVARSLLTLMLLACGETAEAQEEAARSYRSG